jgi:hypothetical protein
MLKCWEWDENKRPSFYQLVHFLKNDPDYCQSDRILRNSILLDDNISNGQKNGQYRMIENDHESRNTLEF